jgi:quercetin dioxygenase-like cupin family protein
MRHLISMSIVCTLGLGSALVFAQAAARPGIHVVELPKSSSGAKQVQSTTLLETPHLKLVSIVIPKGGALPAHAAMGQVSVQAVSGTGELHTGERTERLDVSHLIVLAPATQHDVRASADSDLVLLVHEIMAGPSGMGRGMGMRGNGMRPGMGAGPRGGAPAATEAPATKK